MILLKLMIIFLCILIFFCLKRFSKLKKFFWSKKFVNFNKNNLNSWMNLTKKERYNLSKKESITYMNNRKVLLEEIRNEYKRISRGNSEKN
ncbi:glycoprotein [Prochlorococcus marinus str. MU1415]|nr:glycoprotein [Prochlorococcus marinus str. MU1415]